METILLYYVGYVLSINEKKWTWFYDFKAESFYTVYIRFIAVLYLLV